MKTLVVYDSVYGNTGEIAKAIGEAIAGDVEVLRASQVSPSQLKTFDLLFVGAPTHGGRPTEPMQELLQQVRAPDLEGVNVAAFDTRLTARWVRIFGYAAGRIASKLEEMGATLVGSPEGFFVKGTKGPLKEGELERAADWARDIVERAK
jgi:flavodoxin I